MYQSTTEFGNLVQQDSRTFKCLITYDKVSIATVKSIKFTGGSEGEDDFSLGSTMSQYIEVTIPDGNYLIEGKEILLQIGMDVGGQTEYIPMGYFAVGKPKKSEDQITFTAYDRMMKTERTFSMTGSDTDTVKVLKRIAEITGVAVITAGLTAVTMKVPKGYSCREVLSYVAQLHGTFAVCNRKGQIELHTYVDSGYTVKPGRYWGSFEHNDYVFDVSKFVCYTGQDKDGNSISINSGTGARAVSFSNPFMTQPVLDKVLAAFKDFSYMPGTVKMLGDPRLDPWDVLTVEDLNKKTYKIPVMKREWEFDGGLTDSIEAVGLSEEETNENWKGPNTKEMDRYYAQLVMIDQALVNKLDVDTANITYATIKNLDVVSEKVQEIHGEVGDFKELTAENFSAANAQIDVLNGNYANIKVLLSGGAGIGDLQNIHLTSKNAVIDSALIRNAVIQTVAVSDLMAGTISTNKFLIASDDGGIKISGATQQWSDSDGTIRMQAGRDAKGNFTFSLFDKDGKGVLIDSTGIKENAIADGLIVNKMVADNAGIAGSKLDIPSVVSAINDSSQTIKSSRIWFDDQNQTLNQLYNRMDSNITEVRSTATSASSAASNAQSAADKAQGTADSASSTANAASNTANAAADTAKKALDTLSSISTLDALGAALDNDAHVVHTNTDGSGGDYSECYTKMTVYLGDTDVSDECVFAVAASAEITGRWDAQKRTYYVTAMTSDSGYVDFNALYGVETKYLTTRKGLRLTTRSGKYFLIRHGAHIQKRFSISKAKDGKIGLTYDLHSSTLAIRKQKDGTTLIPASVTFSATLNDNGLIGSYSGRYNIQETEDGTTYAPKYVSASAEIQKIYTPSSANVKAVRCTLLSDDGASELDTQTVIILADAEGLTDDIQNAQDAADNAQSAADKAQESANNAQSAANNAQSTADSAQSNAKKAQEAIVTTNKNVTNIETSVNGLRTELSQTTTDLHGVTDKILLFNVIYNDNGNDTTTLSAVLYKKGDDVTKSYPARWYTWIRKTESGESYLGFGYSITVKNSNYEFGGTTVGTFTTYDTMNLVTRSGNQLCTRSGNHLTVWREN